MNLVGQISSWGTRVSSEAQRRSAGPIRWADPLGRSAGRTSGAGCGDWRSVMVVGLLWMGGILIAMGWFAIGWLARGQENRKYAENRLRYLADQAIEDQW